MLGRQKRLPRSAPRKMWAPALATQPVPIIFTRGPQKRIMSWIVSPDSTCPPGELMRTRISPLPSAASASSWPQTRSATFMSISPKMSTVRALNRACLDRRHRLVGLHALVLFLLLVVKPGPVMFRFLVQCASREVYHTWTVVHGP